MLSEAIKAGDKIEILNKNNFNEIIFSQVEKVINHEKLVTHLPFVNGSLVKFNTNINYFFIFITDKGMLRYEVQVEKMFKVKDLYLMQIKLLTEGERIQRREYFRYNCMLPMKYSVINESNPNEKTPNFQGVIRDISGGGIRFVTNEDITSGAKLKCLVALGNEICVAVGRVLNWQGSKNQKYKHQYRASFIGILPTERDKILQYIFNEQRKSNMKQLNRSDNNDE